MRKCSNPGGISGKVHKLEAAVKSQNERTQEQEKAIEEQQDKINALVVYSLAIQPYVILWHIAKRKDYRYRDAEMRRWAFVLLDNGFIETKQPGGWLNFDENIEGQNLSAIAKLTAAGSFLVQQRGDPL